jgi:hypothetical protein
MARLSERFLRLLRLYSPDLFYEHSADACRGKYEELTAFHLAGIYHMCGRQELVTSLGLGHIPMIPFIRRYPA